MKLLIVLVKLQIVLVKLQIDFVKLQIITTLSVQCGHLCLYVVSFHLVVDLQLI